MTPRLPASKIPPSTGPRPGRGVRAFPDSESRCRSCGLRLAAILAVRGVTEHVLCSLLPPEEYDRQAFGRHLHIVKSGDN